MPGGNKKGHRHSNKPTGESFRFVKVSVTFLLPSGIKGLKGDLSGAIFEKAIPWILKKSFKYCCEAAHFSV